MKLFNYLPKKQSTNIKSDTYFYYGWRLCLSLIFYSSIILSCSVEKKSKIDSFELKIEQLTTGAKHHFFGYIGQCQTIPWNASGQYVLGMEIDTISRMPYADEAATVILVDTYNKNEIIRIDKTYAWNPQQGTMFYWNPLAPETQFFFNDKDIETGKVFTVLYDIKEQKRIKEYRYDSIAIGNGGVAPDGTSWLGINYGRMARLRSVTGYPGALDWSIDEVAPKNDGIFIVDIKTGNERLLVSYFQIEEKIKELNPELNHTGLFINHTLWNRDANKVYFFARAGWDDKNNEKNDIVNVPFTINADGTGLTSHSTFIGGHPEWAEGNNMIGSAIDSTGKNIQVLYDVEAKKIIGQLGNPEIFPQPEGDISLSPDGNWFVNGYKGGLENHFSVLRLSDGVFARSEGIKKGKYVGDIRIDPSPRWNRTNDAILVPGIADNETRQMFIIKIVKSEKSSD